MGGTTYSTTETLTGDTWIDGKPIYRKTFIVNNPVSGTTVDVGTQIDTLINGYGIVNRSDDYIIPATYCYPNGYAFQWALRADLNKLWFYIEKMTVAQVRLTLEYTKN